jgi:hypothetical protein
MASEYWTVSFEEFGEPKTGLSPIIDIIELPDTLIISGASMTENFNLPGSYYYEHTTYNPTKHYKARIDGGDDCLDSRYAYGTNRDDIQIANKIPDNNFMGSSVKTNKDDEIDEILLDTDEIQGKLPINNIMGSSVKDDKNDEIDAILVDTSISIPTQIIDLESKVDIINDNVIDIKTKTDNLPADTEAVLATIEEILLRDVGLSHENIHQEHTWNGDLHESSIIQLYDSAANTAIHDGITGLVAAYSLTIEYDVSSNPIKHTMVRTT